MKLKSILFSISLLFICASYGMPIKLQDSLYKAYVSEKNYKKQIDILHRLAELYTTGKLSAGKQNDSVLKISNLILQESKKRNYKKGVSLGYYYYGLYEHLNDNHNAAIVYFKKAKKISVIAHDKTLTAYILRELGNTYYFNRDNVNALVSYKEALELAKLINNKEILISSYCGIANIYFIVNDFEKSEKHYLIALKIIDSTEGTEDLTIKKNLGLLYGELKEYKKGLTYLFKAKDKELAQKNYPNLAVTYNFIAEVYRKSDSLNMAICYINKALNLMHLHEFSNPNITADAQLRLAQIYYKQKKIEQAKNHALKALNLSEEFLDMDYKKEVSKLLFDVFDTLKDPENANKYAKLALEMQEEINTKQTNNKTITSELIDLETALIEEKNKNKTNLIEARHKRQILIITIASISLIGLLLLYKNTKLNTEKKLAQKRYLEKINLEEQISKIEHSIAKDLHDNFGNRISNVITSFNIIKEDIAKKINKEPALVRFYKNHELNLDRLSIDLKDLLWASNPFNNTIYALYNRLEHIVIKDFNSKSNKKIVFKACSDRDYKLPKLANKQILLALKEIISNFDKHALSKDLEIIFIADQNSLKIETKDQGKGFDINKLSRINGIYNIKKRLESINFTTIINSKVGVGTNILFTGSLR